MRHFASSAVQFAADDAQKGFFRFEKSAKIRRIRVICGEFSDAKLDDAL